MIGERERERERNKKSERFFCFGKRRVMWSGGVRFAISYGKDFLRRVGPTPHSLMRERRKR